MESQNFSENTLDENPKSATLKKAAQSHAKLSCRVCYGRGIVQKSIPPNAKELIPLIVFEDNCQCVKNSILRKGRTNLNGKITVFELGITPLNVERSLLTKRINAR